MCGQSTNYQVYRRTRGSVNSQRAWFPGCVSYMVITTTLDGVCPSCQYLRNVSCQKKKGWCLPWDLPSVVFIPTKIINLAYGMWKHTIRSQQVVWIDRTSVAEGQRSVFANWQKRSPCTVISLLAFLFLYLEYNWSGQTS